MTDCAELLLLVEKLSDFEATAAEKLAAGTHLEKCPSCRSHLEFLAALTEESRSTPFPEPPESYWEHLPRKVLDRIDSESRRPARIWSPFLAPSMLRWGALGATLLVVTAIGVSLLRESSRPAAPPPVRLVRPVRPAPAAQAPEAEARVAAEPSAAPSMARDEAAPAGAQLESLPSPVEREQASPKSMEPAPAAPADVAAAVESKEGGVASLRSENVQAFESASRTRAPAAPAAVSRVALQDCDAARRAVASLGGLTDNPDGSDARFRLAICSLESHEREKTDELRTRAIEDAEAFLAGESDGSRAGEIRVKLRRIRPD